MDTSDVLDTSAVYDSSILVPARKIFLRRNHSLWCIVEDQDYEWLANLNWNWGQTGKRYCHRRKYAKRNYGPDRTTEWMHRAIMHQAEPLPDYMEAIRQVDHINGQTLDNRRCNLRWVTMSENRFNRIPYHLVPKLSWIWDELCIDVAAREQEELDAIPFD